MRRDPELYLIDIQKVARYLHTRRRQRAFTELETDQDLRYGVERAFEILSEALQLLERYHPELAQQFGELPQIVALRNHIAHRYWRIDPAVLWRIMDEDVPILAEKTDRLLTERGF